MDTKLFLTTYIDHAAPRLDTYEQAIYLYLVRNGPMNGTAEVVFPIESSASRMALGVAKKGARISRDSVRRKLASLEKKGFLRILGVEYSGTRVQVVLPEEMPGLVASECEVTPMSLEETDFFSSPLRRDAIFARDSQRCFYCGRRLGDSDRVLDHVVPQARGGNGYRNLVASCLGCNSRKGAVEVADFARGLFRDRLLNENELRELMQRLEDLSAGKLKPRVA